MCPFDSHSRAKSSATWTSIVPGKRVGLRSDPAGPMARLATRSMQRTRTLGTHPHPVPDICARNSAGTPLQRWKIPPAHASLHATFGNRCGRCHEGVRWFQTPLEASECLRPGIHAEGYHRPRTIRGMAAWILSHAIAWPWDLSSNPALWIARDRTRTNLRKHKQVEHSAIGKHHISTTLCLPLWLPVEPRRGCTRPTTVPWRDVISSDASERFSIRRRARRFRRVHRSTLPNCGTSILFVWMGDVILERSWQRPRQRGVPHECDSPIELCLEELYRRPYLLDEGTETTRLGWHFRSSFFCLSCIACFFVCVSLGSMLLLAWT